MSSPTSTQPTQIASMAEGVPELDTLCLAEDAIAAILSEASLNPEDRADLSLVLPALTRVIDRGLMRGACEEQARVRETAAVARAEKSAGVMDALRAKDGNFTLLLILFKDLHEEWAESGDTVHAARQLFLEEFATEQDVADAFTFFAECGLAVKEPGTQVLHPTDLFRSIADVLLPLLKSITGK